MTNQYFNNSSNPQPNSQGSSSLIRAEFAGVKAGFDKLPPIAGNPNKLVKMNASATAMEATNDMAGVTLSNLTLASPAIATPTGIVKSDVGLGLVDNTADEAKPVSTAQALADTAVAQAAAADATAKADAAQGNSTPAAHAGAGGAAHVGATASINGFMTAADKAKLDGVAASANNYTHPANHHSSIITQDASNRFVTDAEKASWSAKQPAGTYATGTGTANGTNTGDQAIPTTLPASDVSAWAKAPDRPDYSDLPIRLNPRRITTNLAIASAYNAASVGPLSIADGVTVTVGDNATWSIH